MAEHIGREVYIKIDVNGVGGAGADWRTIANQRGGSFGRSTTKVDATHKGTGGYEKNVVTRRGWSVSGDGALEPTDAAWTYLLGLWKGTGACYIQVDASVIGGEKTEGPAILDSLDYEFPEAEMVTFSVAFTGNGEPVASV